MLHYSTAFGAPSLGAQTGIRASKSLWICLWLKERKKNEDNEIYIIFQNQQPETHSAYLTF